MHINDSLDALYSEITDAYAIRASAKQQMAAYNQELAALQEEYREYFLKLAALKDKYQFDTIQSAANHSQLSKNITFTVKVLTQRLCWYYRALSDEEQDELEAALEGYDIEFTCPKEDRIDWLDVTDDDGFTVYHVMSFSSDFIVLETRLSFKKLFEVMRQLLPQDFFSAPGDA